MTLDDLADLLRRRDCDSIWYFHTDHFEPWSSNIDDESARAVDRMALMARQSRYARRLSLFYAVFVPYRLEGDTAVDNGHPVRGDEIAFGARSERQEGLARAAIRPLVTDDRHEVHLHVHHEFWTRNASEFDNPVSRWVNARSTAEADSERLDRYFRQCCEAIAREIGRPFEHWGFIHGNWALNASDPDICHVEDEMAIIMRHGGFGDFSFPAGRGGCDAELETPFTCLPLALPRAYDDPRADPRPILKQSGVLRPDRFFIWNSPIKSGYSSLDYYSRANRDLFQTPERMVEQWLDKSVVLDHCLFLKTHAHSMKWEYRIGDPDSVIPHCYPDVIKVFDCLARVCERARIELRPVTVNEVMARLREFDFDPKAPAPPQFVAPPARARAVVPQPTSELKLLSTAEPAASSREHKIALPFAPDGGRAWYVALPPTLHRLTDNDREPSRSPLVLVENGAPLGPPHSLHKAIRDAGGGRYSFWKTGLWFSVPDGSDPNRNGRIYSISREAMTPLSDGLPAADGRRGVLVT